MADPAPCPRCRTPLPDTAINVANPQPCPTCGAEVQAELYPAAFRPLRIGQSGETILVEGEASCFYHPQKRAAVPCAWCGRFLCALCDVELKGEHICPACFEGGRRKGKLADLENRRTLYDSVALHLAIIPFFFTGVAAIAVAIYAWKKPQSLLRRSRVRLWLAIVFGTVQTAIWAFAILRES